MMNYKKMMSIGLSAALSLSLLTACGGNNSAGNSGEKQVVIYSNADEEAVTAMKNALDGNGYEGKYIFQTYGTSELGGQAAGGRDKSGGRPGDHEHLLPPERPGAEQHVPASGL